MSRSDTAAGSGRPSGCRTAAAAASSSSLILPSEDAMFGISPMLFLRRTSLVGELGRRTPEPKGELEAAWLTERSVPDRPCGLALTVGPPRPIERAVGRRDVVAARCMSAEACGVAVLLAWGVEFGEKLSGKALASGVCRSGGRESYGTIAWASAGTGDGFADEMV